MTDWGLPPEYILENWTEAKLLLMFVKRKERILAMYKPSEPKQVKPRVISDREMFAQMGVKVGRV